MTTTAFDVSFDFATHFSKAFRSACCLRRARTYTTQIKTHMEPSTVVHAQPINAVGGAPSAFQQATAGAMSSPTNAPAVPQSAPEATVVDLESERRKQHVGNMEKIEKEFQELKDKFFNEKIEELTSEYESIRNGTCCTRCTHLIH
jgi:hypothetical protein